MGIFGRLCCFPIDHTFPTNHPFPRATMSTSTYNASRSNLGSIFDSAIQAYKNKTRSDITTHPLAIELQSCHSPNAVLAVLRNQVSVAGQPHSHNGSESFSKWLIPMVNVIYAFSSSLGEGVGLVNRTIPSLVEKICSDICLSGLLTCQSDFCGNRCSPPGQSFLVPYRNLF